MESKARVREWRTGGETDERGLIKSRCGDSPCWQIPIRGGDSWREHKFTDVNTMTNWLIGGPIGECLRKWEMVSMRRELSEEEAERASITIGFPNGGKRRRWRSV